MMDGRQGRMSWPAGGNELISIQDRIIGPLPAGGISVLATSPAGHG